jgi:hypothetical protein
MKSFLRSAVCSFSVFTMLVSTAGAQGGDEAPKNRTREKGLPQISVIDKLLSIEASLAGPLKRTSEEQWAKDYQALYQKFMRDGQMSGLIGAGSNEVVNAFVLGIKASDAVLALKARNAEALNLCAEQIEQLALKMGATKKELGMADTVKRYANAGRWLDAFLALGFLQRSVLNYLRENPEKEPQAVMVIVGGWLQGGRCVTDVVQRNYSPDVSNILREPRLVTMLLEEVQALPSKYIGDPMLGKVLAALPEIKNRVNVGLYDPVKEENVKWLHQTFDELVKMIAPKGAGDSAPAAVPVK